ncbi:hypothetical protein [Streptomyces tardus]|uniref:hypothetical protein n=1 Tax=Streptomyces tardus TaxID=2780544 RepID=UPI00355841B5
MDQQFWDELYGSREQLFSGAVNGVLVTETAELPVGRALDLGCGAVAHNRNARRYWGGSGATRDPTVGDCLRLGLVGGPLQAAPLVGVPGDQRRPGGGQRSRTARAEAADELVGRRPVGGARCVRRPLVRGAFGGLVRVVGVCVCFGVDWGR